ncbi:hypothetical protein TCAL_14413 [Tigriopus californicus]|uniref:PHD-type domain-containing protein n=1 Tax=Tigriopus californicus TaxID=6832 RepID=A0A553PLV4_TIGCA|nr:uncharacterized protein LOC131890456 [Tigriopus californicus]TRY78660.1 hypothetical protein TCAL_14413 [Tigriopus californicus]
MNSSTPSKHGRWILTPPTKESLSLVQMDDPHTPYSPLEVQPPSLDLNSQSPPSPVKTDSPLVSHAPQKEDPPPCGSDVLDGSRRLSSRIRTKVRQIHMIYPEEQDDIQDIQDFLDGDEYRPSDTDSEASFESEQLGCVCQRPWNKRHMILCNRCQRWFHSYCMGTTKAELKKAPEWNCPKCSAKTVQKHSAPAAKGKKAQRKKKAPKPAKTTSKAAASEVKLCMVCGKQPCRASSVFCSDDCIAMSVERVAAEEVLPIGSVIRKEAIKPKTPLKINESSVKKLPMTAGIESTSIVDQVSPPEEYNILEMVKRVSAPIPASVTRQGKLFTTSERFFDAPLDVLLTFLYEAQTGQTPVHHQAIPLCDVRGGLIYVHKGPDTRSVDSKQVPWSGDGGAFTNVSITRYPLLPTSESIFEQICVMNPSVRNRKLFKRKVIWLSFCPDYVVVQYIGDELACKESTSHDLPQVQALLKLPKSTTIIPKTQTDSQPTAVIDLLDDDDVVEEISVINQGTTLQKLPENSRLVGPSRNVPKISPKKVDQGSQVVKSVPRMPQAQIHVEDRLSRLKGISLTPSKGNVEQSVRSKVELLDLEEEDSSMEVGFNPKILSVKSLRMTNENTPTKKEINRNSMGQDEAVIIDIIEDEGPSGHSVSVKPDAGSGSKRRRCLKPRRNLPRTLKQSLYKELRKNSPDKVEPSPQESAVPKHENGDIEILSTVLPPEQEQKTMVQVIVKPRELKALKNLGFTVVKSES